MRMMSRTTFSSFYVHTPKLLEEKRRIYQVDSPPFGTSSARNLFRKIFGILAIPLPSDVIIRYFGVFFRPPLFPPPREGRPIRNISRDISGINSSTASFFISSRSSSTKGNYLHLNSKGRFEVFYSGI